MAYIPRLLAMLVDSGWFPRLQRDPGLREELVQEGLRVATPSPVMLRSARRAAELGDVRVRPGDRVVLATFLADRQPGDFAPGEGRAARQKRLWFGAGPHFCLGAPLALAQIRCVLDAVLLGAEHGGLRIVRRRIARGVLIPGYRSLVLRTAAESRAEPEGRGA